jgi:MFS family permease
VARRPIVLTFGLLTATFAAGYGVMFTVLNDFRDEYGISEGALGWVVAMGFFAAFFAQLLLAPMADRGHARILVVIGMMLNVVGMVTMAFGTDVWPLLAGRFIAGVGVGMAVPAVRRIVILAEPDRLGHNLGRLISADVAGFAFGPALSAVLVGPFGIPAPFLVIAAITIVCLPVIWRVHVDESADAPRTKLALDLLRVRPVLAAVALGSGLFLMIGTFDSLWVLVLDDLGSADWVANVGITFFAVPFILFAAVGGRMAQRHGPFRIASAGLLCGALSMFLYGQMTTARRCSRWVCSTRSRTASPCRAPAWPSASLRRPSARPARRVCSERSRRSSGAWEPWPPATSTTAGAKPRPSPPPASPCWRSPGSAGGGRARRGACGARFRSSSRFPQPELGYSLDDER